MRQLTFVQPRRFEWWDVPEPRLEGPRDALVEPLVVTRCDVDFYIATGLYPVLPKPFAVGHEVVARVVELGERVRQLAVGDVVIFPFQISCGECGPCLRGHTAGCESVPFRSSFGLAGIHGVEWGGGLSDRMRVPFADHLLLKLPDGCDWAGVAGAADNVADGYRAVAPQLKARPGADVLVVGGLAQSIGLYAAQAAKALTRGRVLYLDSDPRRRAIAVRMGIETMTMPEGEDPEPVGAFPITVEASATQEGLLLAMRSTAPFGVCSCVTGGATPFHNIPRMDAFGRGITLDISRAHVQPMLREVVEHVAAGRLDPLVLDSPRYSFDEGVEGMLDPSAKVVFVRHP